MKVFKQDHGSIEDLPNAGKYRKKPVLIHAAQINEEFIVHSKEGVVTGKPGDYLMKGVEGELYICDQGIFRKTYERVPETGPIGMDP